MDGPANLVFSGQTPDPPKVMPRCEVPDGPGDLIGDGGQLDLDPALEIRQVGVSISKYLRVDEYGAEVFYGLVRFHRVQAVMAQGDRAVSDPGQQPLDGRGKLPGQNALRSVGRAKRVYQFLSGVAVVSCRGGQEQSGQVVTKRTSSADAAAVVLTLGSAQPAVKIGGDPCAVTTCRTIRPAGGTG